MSVESKVECNEVRKELTQQDSVKINALLDEIDQNQITQSEADDIARSFLEQQKEVSDVSFSGSPEMAKRYLDSSYRHMNLSRKYERDANELETKIKRGIEPKSKMSEVKRLRSKALSEKSEAEKCKRYAEQILRS